MNPSDSESNASYRVLRRLPPFYTIQPNEQTQSKQVACWTEFLLDAAVAAFKQTGALGIVLTPHSPIFRSPREVNRTLSTNGARLVLRRAMETHGGYRCLPFAVESGVADEEDAELAAQQRAFIEEQEQKILAEKQKRVQQQREEEEFDLMDANSPTTPQLPQSQQQQQQQEGGAIFLNCDAVIILAMSCERIMDSINKWHDEDQTSHIFSVAELAEDKDLTKRFSASLSTTSVEIGEPVLVLGLGPEQQKLQQQQQQQQQQQGNSNSSLPVQLKAVSAESVIEAVMTTEHPAMAHLKRPQLLESSGSLGLKFAA